MSPTCEWPAYDGATQCGVDGPAVNHFTATNGKWGRWCCKKHARRAERLGWKRTPDWVAPDLPEGMNQ